MKESFIILAIVGVVLAVIIATITVFFRALVLFPWWVEEIGLRPAFSRYKFSVILTGAALFYMAVNLTGFSWSRLHWVADEEMIDNAIRFHYAGAYKNAEELRADYPDFDSQARFWGSWERSSQGNSVLRAALGFGSYEVRLPDAIVPLRSNGMPTHSIHCGGELCDSYPPRTAEFGVVGVINKTYSNPFYNYALRWQAPGGTIHQKGVCFYAYHADAGDIALTITGDGRTPVQINRRDKEKSANLYGFYVMEVDWARDGEPEGSEHLRFIRITREQFRKWTQCDPAQRREWPLAVHV